MVDLQDRLERVSDVTTEAWLDAMKLREGRLLWEAVAPHLDGYQRDGAWLAWWYRDWLLAGCRRLLDQTKGTSSFVRALRLIEPVADQLTPEVVLCRWELAGTAGRSDESVTKQVLDDLTDGSPLNSAFVDGQVRRLRKRHSQAVMMANEHVAHRSEAPTVESLAVDDVVALEQDVLDAVFKWHRVVNGSHLMTEQPHPGLAGPLATALRLFDWEEYHRAKTNADLELGPWANEYSEVVGIEYVVQKPDVSGDPE